MATWTGWVAWQTRWPGLCPCAPGPTGGAVNVTATYVICVRTLYRAHTVRLRWPEGETPTANQLPPPPRGPRPRQGSALLLSWHPWIWGAWGAQWPMDPGNVGYECTISPSRAHLDASWVHHGSAARDASQY
jgi:hypothetical protein